MAAPISVQDIVNVANALIISNKFPNILAVLGPRPNALGWVMGIIQQESSFRVGAINTAAQSSPYEARLIEQLKTNYPNVPAQNALYAGTAMGLMQGLGAYCIKEAAQFGYSLSGTALSALSSYGLQVPITVNVFTLFDPNSLGSVLTAATNELVLGLAVLESKCMAFPHSATAAVNAYYGSSTATTTANINGKYLTGSYASLVSQQFYVARSKLNSPVLVAAPIAGSSTSNATPSNSSPPTTSISC